jgi:Fur family ferric uptake transcriptional regulator
MPEQDPQELWRRYLKAKGLNVTRARQQILAEVTNWPAHFDAAQLWMKLSAARIAPATIYRTLDLLVEAGLVRKLQLNPNRAQYEALLGHRHHDHLVCTRCGAVSEFSDGRLEERLAELPEELGHLSQRHELTIYGLCPTCRVAPEQPPVALDESVNQR